MSDINLEYLQRQEDQWEVSSFDVAQSIPYKRWAAKSIKGMSTGAIDSMLDDINNIHFAFVRPPRHIMDKALHSLGMDLEESVERQLCLHKTFGGTYVNGERYVGTVRKDNEWKLIIKKACS